MADETNDTPVQPTDPDGVRARIGKIAAQRDEALTHAEALASQLEQVKAKAAAADEMQAELEKMRGQLSALESARAEDLGMVSAGLTNPEAMDIARTMHARAGVDAPLVDWVSGYLSEPSAAPGWLRGYLDSGSPPPPPTPAPKQDADPQRAPLPSPNANVLSPPPSNGELSVDQIRGMSDEEFVAALGSGKFANLLGRR